MPRFAMQAAFSQLGPRHEQQDRWAVNEQRAIVVDGMGGHRDGALAAETAVTALMGASLDMSAEAAMYAAGSTVYELGGNADRAPGAVAVLAHIEGDDVIVAWAGDSRVYHRSAATGTATLLTRDHCIASIMAARDSDFDIDRIRTREGLSRFQTNPLSCLGGGGPLSSLQIDTVTLPANPDDRLFLVSDGVWGSMPHTDLLALLSSERPLQDVVDTIDEIVGPLTRDNATLLAVAIE